MNSSTKNVMSIFSHPSVVPNPYDFLFIKKTKDVNHVNETVHPKMFKVFLL